MSVFVHFPLAAGLIVVARPLIVLLFSSRWQGSVLFFQLMCGSGFLYPMHFINLDLLKVKGRSDLYLRLDIIKRCLILGNIAVTYRWGVNAMLIGQVVISVLGYSINSYYAKDLIGYSMFSQIRDVSSSFLLSGLTAGAMAALGLLLRPAGDIVLLAGQTLFGMGAYLGLQILVRSEELREYLALAGRLRHRRAAA
jgi:O-antigen/teichoic acid export membrane protein